LREILSDDPAMQVKQDPDGTIRMTEIGVPSDLLNVKISHILFETSRPGQPGIYTANGALRLILRAPEVVAFMKTHNIEWPYHGDAVPGNLGAWPPESPHISGSLENVTLSGALDHILRTFGGIWIYEDCPRSDSKNRVVYFRFYYLRKIGSRTGAQVFVDE
jgi:hypothetical protein